MSTDLAPEDVDGRIDEIVAEFSRRRLPLEWSTGRSTRPQDLGQRLLRKGFEHAFDVPGMAIDLVALPEDRPPDGLRIEAARTHEELLACVRITLTTFELSLAFLPRLVEIEEGQSPEERARVRHYLARLDGRPVATAELFLGEGSAGLYCVGTLPEARGRGFARAATLRALGDAREMGFRIGTLQATPMGEPVYRRLGFRAYATLGSYVKA